MRVALDSFAATYAEARAKFLAAAQGLVIESHAEPRAGLEGEALAMDVVRLGADDAQALLIVSSGCHGIEGSNVSASSAPTVSRITSATNSASAAWLMVGG